MATAESQDIAQALRALAIALERVGRYEEALAADVEAVGRYRALTENLPKVYASELATARNHLRRLLGRLGREDEFPIIDLRATHGPA